MEVDFHGTNTRRPLIARLGGYLGVTYLNFGAMQLRVSPSSKICHHLDELHQSAPKPDPGRKATELPS